MAEYRELKTFKNKVPNIKVFSSSTEFRRYQIEISTHGNPIYTYQNQKPTIKELRELVARY